jgi:hypothetical protein
MYNWARDSFMSKRIIDTLRLSSPWTDDKILSLLTEQVALHDDVVEYNRRVSYGISVQHNDTTRVLRFGQIAAIADMYEDGWNHKQVRTYVLDNWGIELDRTHAHRIKERAEKRRRKNENRGA